MKNKPSTIKAGDEKSEARFHAILCGILFLFALLSPWPAANFLIFIVLTYAAWKLFFHGTTLISMSLKGQPKRLFQVAVAITFPFLASLYFIRDVSEFTLAGTFGHMLNLWFLLPFFLIGYVSWYAADQLDTEYPFRGFIIAATVIFAICYFGHHGVHSEVDDYGDDFTFLDEEAAQQAATTGRYFGQYLVYTLLSYGCMLSRMQYKNRIS